MMKKRMLLALVIVLCAAALCACGAKEPERFQVVTQPTQAAVNATSVPTEAPTEAPAYDYDSGDYDPTSEEGKLDFIPGVEESNPFDDAPVQQPAEITPAPTMNSVYAGATPVVIDPIDKPTATPVPAISFSEYAVYDATALGLSFQAPTGWLVDAEQPDAFTVKNPDSSMAFTGFLTISVQSTSVKQSKSQLKTLLGERVSDVKGSYGGKHWSTTKTAERTLLDSYGVYQDYSVVTTDGAEVKGRVQVAYANGKVYTIHMACPAPYYEQYKKSVYNKMRSTLTVTK